MKCIPKGKVTEAFPLYFKFGFIEKIQDKKRESPYGFSQYLVSLYLTA